METYPSETLRAELSAKTGLSDRQLQMWFCHRRLKDRKIAPGKKAKKVEDPLSPSPPGREMIAPPGNASICPTTIPFPVGSGELRKAVARVSPAVSRIGAEVSLGKRYYEPPILAPQPRQLSVLELRIIASVEAQLGEPLRDDGPILGVEFDPLPPGAFGAPIGINFFDALTNLLIFHGVLYWAMLDATLCYYCISFKFFPSCMHYV